MSLVDYTTLAAVRSYGDFKNTSFQTDADLTALITAVSRQLDVYGNQVYGRHEQAISLPARVDKDGTLLCYPPTPTIASIRSVGYRAGGMQSWLRDVSVIETEDAPHGAIVRVFGVNDRTIQRVSLSYVGGWLADEIPADFEHKMRRAVFWEAKLRSAPMEKTANLELGVVVIPQAWPPDLRQAFDPYRRMIL